MSYLKIDAEKHSPEIEFDCSIKKLEIKGKSYPPNPGDFFAPVFSLLENHLADTDGELSVDIDLLYFNSGSAKILTDLFARLDIAAKEEKKVCVNWIYSEDDEDNLEFGEEFREDVEILPFNLVCKDE